MTWVRIDDGAPLHPKLLDAGPEAAWLWCAGLAYCNRNHTDGLIAARHLAALYPGAWSAERLTQLAGRLVEVRLWEAAGSDYQVHDYAHFQEEATREVVDARRVYERDRKRAQRLAKRPGHVPDNVPGTTAGHVPGTNTGTPPGTEGGTAGATAPAPAAAAVGASTVAAVAAALDTPGVPPPRPGPTRPVSAEGDSVAAGLCPGATIVRPVRTKAKGEPLPFKPLDALRAIASTSSGRFADAEPRDISQGYAIALSAAIRSYPTIQEWECLGAWLASNDCSYTGRLAVSWAASSALRDGMLRAREWAAKGSAPAAPRPRPGARPAAPAPVSARELMRQREAQLSLAPAPQEIPDAV